MSIFVDTGVFYAQQHEAAGRHEVATDALREILTGRFGTIYTSDYVHDEAVTLVRARTGEYGAAKRVSDRILGDESPISLLYVDERRLRESLETFERYRDHELGFTDATTVTLLETRDVDSVLSFDGDFDGVVERTDPAEIT
jgi:predicted nucleic acid-binding protein